MDNMNDQEMDVWDAMKAVLTRLEELKAQQEREEAFEAMPNQDDEGHDWADDWFAVQDVPLDENEPDFEPW